MDSNPSSAAAFSALLKQGIWILCIPAWLFGTIERGATAMSDHVLSTSDVIQILTAAFFLASWLLLKPNRHRIVIKP
ncbi:MAG: hypothetical protein KME43_17420 [Myxacorys chilensis ATA2-1-KO14]|jgi:hypothetical protein|nr:hypothetical protein [Myxacorys chilensis ATA2-1-KO14]